MSLTTFQTGLIADLQKEFDRLNPAAAPASGKKRFGIETIHKCIDDEAAFIASIKSFNDSMIKKLRGDFIEMIDAFRDEGYLRPIVGITKNGYYPTEEKFFSGDPTTTSELPVLLTSITKKRQGDSQFDYAEGFDYKMVYTRYKMDPTYINLDNGRKIQMNKIIGLRFYEYTWHSSFANPEYKTLDDLIQSSRTVQQAIVNLCK